MERLNIRVSFEKKKYISDKAKQNNKTITQYVIDCINYSEENKTLKLVSRDFLTNEEYLTKIIKNTIENVVKEELEYLLLKTLHDVLKKENDV